MRENIAMFHIIITNEPIVLNGCLYFTCKDNQLLIAYFNNFIAGTNSTKLKLDYKPTTADELYDMLLMYFSHLRAINREDIPINAIMMIPEKLTPSEIKNIFDKYRVQVKYVSDIEFTEKYNNNPILESLSLSSQIML